MAFALGEVDLPLDPTIGRIVFYQTQWSFDENFESNYSRKELTSHACSEQELGLETTTAGKPMFMPIEPSQERTLLYNRKRFLCLKDEDVAI